MEFALVFTFNSCNLYFYFLIAESQKHALRFFLDGDELVMEFEKEDEDLIYLTNVKIKYWWAYRGGGNSTGKDLYMLVEGETGERIMLRDALILPWETSPKGWSYSHLPVDTDLFILETSKLEQLVNALSA